MPKPFARPGEDATGAERTKHAMMFFDQRKQLATNRKRMALLLRFFGKPVCTYCRQGNTNAVLIPLVLMHRPGFACIPCIKKFLF